VDAAVELARTIAGFPQTCMRSDRLSALEQLSLAAGDAMRNTCAAWPSYAAANPRRALKGSLQAPGAMARSAEPLLVCPWTAPLQPQEEAKLHRSLAISPTKMRKL
jgi:hypothetical protein